MGIAERIKEIEDEIFRTQKNKATEFHIGILKARISRLKQQQTSATPGGGAGIGFDIRRSGDARVALVGFPSVGKSSLLNKFTNTFSESADYEFTTLDCKAGHLYHKKFKIQLLDLPGIIEGAHKGLGKGRQVIGTIRSADLILMILDITKLDFTSSTLLEKTTDISVLKNELYKCNILINQKRKQMSLSINKSGGININRQNTSSKCISDNLITAVLKEYKIFHCLLQIKEDISVDDLIDKVTGKNKYTECIFVFNKADKIGEENFNNLKKYINPKNNASLVSIEREWNCEELKDLIVDKLSLIRIYTKRRGSKPDLENPVVLKEGSTVKELVLSIHSDMLSRFKFAQVTGKSVKYPAMKVGLKHFLMDEDIVQIF